MNSEINPKLTTEKVSVKGLISLFKSGERIPGSEFQINHNFFFASGFNMDENKTDEDEMIDGFTIGQYPRTQARTAEGLKSGIQGKIIQTLSYMLGNLIYAIYESIEKATGTTGCHCGKCLARFLMMSLAASSKGQSKSLRVAGAETVKALILSNEPIIPKEDQSGLLENLADGFSLTEEDLNKPQTPNMGNVPWEDLDVN
jgi:hypothetical protein